MSRLRPIHAALAVSAVLIGLAPLASRGGAAPAAVISQTGRLFAPSDVEIASGSTIRFTNDDPFLHQIFVSSPTFSFDSNEQPPGQSVEIPFPTPGEFRVLCGIHPKMSLRVLVR